MILSPVPGEARLAAALASRLKAMGAVTRGDQTGVGVFGSESLSVNGFRWECDGVDKALQRLAADAQARSKSNVVDAELCDAFVSLDLSISTARSSSESSLHVSKSTLQFLGRSMLLPIETQKRVFARLQQEFDRTIVSNGNADPTEASSLVAEAFLDKEENLVVEDALPHCRILRLRVNGKGFILLSGPVLSLLHHCQHLCSTWKLTRYRIEAQGKEVCGVVISEEELRTVSRVLQFRQANRVPDTTVAATSGLTGGRTQNRKRGPCTPVTNEKRLKQHTSGTTKSELETLTPEKSGIAAAEADPRLSRLRSRCGNARLL